MTFCEDMPGMLTDAWEEYITGGDRLICDSETAIRQHLCNKSECLTVYETTGGSADGYTWGIDPKLVIEFPWSDLVIGIRTNVKMNISIYFCGEVYCEMILPDFSGALWKLCIS